MRSSQAGSDDEKRIAQIARKTKIPLERLRRAALGQLTLSREEYGELLASNMPLPKGIKKPFGN